MKKSITLILPAYNEKKTIGQTILEAAAYFESHNFQYEIIVSADGNDGTRELAEEMGFNNPRIHVMGQVERHGKGYGIRQAVLAAQGDYIGFSDADNKTPISEFDKIFPLLEQGFEMVIGSRAGREAVIERYQPWFRQIGSRGFGLLMHTVTGLWEFQDTQCGFKFFQGFAARNLFARQKINGYMVDVEILYLARLMKYKVAQVPVRWRDDGDSRLQLVRGNIQNVQDLFRIRFGGKN